MYPKEFIKKLRYSLPDEIKNVIESEEIFSITETLNDTYQLSYEQYGKLQREISLLLMGINIPDMFVTTLTEKLGLSKDIALKIATDVAKKLISKIPEKVLQAQVEYAQARLKELPPVAQQIPPVTPSQPIAGKRGSLVDVPRIVPEVPPSILPEVLPGETVHVVPHVETAAPLISSVPTPAPIIPPASLTPDVPPKRPNLTLPKSDYDHGQDPYRESVDSSQ